MPKTATFSPDECAVRMVTGKVKDKNGVPTAEDSITAWTIATDQLEAHRLDAEFAAAFDASPDAAAIAAAEQAARDKKAKK